jgi:hypothetical protein
VDADRFLTDTMTALRAARLPSAEAIERLLVAQHCKAPDRTALIEIGRSHYRRPILALLIGRGVTVNHTRPSLLLTGAHHGNEPLSAAFVLDAIATLLANDKKLDRVLDEITVVTVPLVNPDGYETPGGRGRKNGRDNDNDGKPSALDGVDINRNYPFRWNTVREPWSSAKPLHHRYRGPSPASEPETRAVMRLANAERFAAAISYHTGAVRLLVPYTIPNVKSPEPNVGWSIAKLMQRAPVEHPEGYINVESRLYPVDGVEQDWLLYNHGTIAFLLEGSSKALVPGRSLPRLLAAVRSGWIVLTQRFLDGPTLSGRVLDPNGAPVEAEVSLDEIRVHEGERWTSRCRDGHFDRFLPKPGRYHLRVHVDGQPEVVREIDVGSERVAVDVVLPGARGGGPCPSSAEQP